MDFLKKRISQKITVPFLMAYLLFVGATFLYVQDVARAEYTWKPIGPASTYQGLTDTPNAWAASTIQFTNSAADAIVQSTNFTYDGDLNLSGGDILNTSGGVSTGSLIVSGGASIDTDTLYVDQANNRVGIGTTTPDYSLTVIGPTRHVGDLRFDWEIRPDGALCSNGQILKKTGSGNWDCASDSTGSGDITAVVAGTGLTGGGTSGSVTLNNSFGTLIDESEMNIATSPSNHYVLEYSTSTNTPSWTPIGAHHIVNGSIQPQHIADTNARTNGMVLTSWSETGFTWTWINGTMIGEGAVGSYQINNQSITNDDLQNSSVTSEKIVNGTITGSDVSSSTLSGDHIVNGTITSADITDSTITGSDLSKDAVSNSHIQDGTITGTKIANGTITYSDTDVNSVQRRVTGTCSSGIYSIWSSGGAGCVSSDIRLKDIYGEYDGGLDEILKLKAIEYSFKEGNARGFKADEIHGGFIAQEVQQILPTAVTRNTDGYLDFHMGDITVAIVNAIQEFYAEAKGYFAKTNANEEIIKKQQQEIDALELEIRNLKSEFKALITN